MSKVDWITWKTNVEEIINPSEELQIIKEKVLAYINQLETHVTEELNRELTKGGLEKDTFDIMGISPANDTAKKIVNVIDNMKQNLNTFIVDITKQLDEQKQIEKEQLINAIEEKINEEKKKLENTQILQSKLINNNQIVSNEDVNEIISVTKERINMLIRRLNVAKSL